MDACSHALSLSTVTVAEINDGIVKLKRTGVARRAVQGPSEARLCNNFVRPWFARVMLP